MNMNKLHNGQMVTSHGIINTPKSPNVRYTTQNQKTVGCLRWVFLALLALAIGAVLFILENIETIRELVL
ncbi:MAG: hypothetical protein EHM20_15975 [Alphaproteobacteria bacterium]|nr:MAG: hypothetical protein EHM20_15975 [Alphaproteobacteria bacterium]